MNTIIVYFILSIVSIIGGRYVARNRKAKKIAEFLYYWVPIIYDAVNNMVLQNPALKHRDKGRLFIQKLTEILAANGIKVTPEIIFQAQTIADSLHYQDKQMQQQQAPPVPPPNPIPAYPSASMLSGKVGRA